MVYADRYVHSPSTGLPALENVPTAAARTADDDFGENLSHLTPEQIVEKLIY
jgi:hypothetical protein